MDANIVPAVSNDQMCYVSLTYKAASKVTQIPGFKEGFTTAVHML